MILTPAQREARARVVGYIQVIGPMPCPACGGSMMTDIAEDEVGWACILCPHEKKWNVPDGDGFMHLRPEPSCLRLTDDQEALLHQRFRDDVKQIDIVREFHLSRQAVVHMKMRWMSKAGT